MNEHVLANLSSLHTRLSNLETSILRLAGIEIPPNDYTHETEALKQLETFVKDLNIRRRAEHTPIFYVSAPMISEILNPRLEIEGPLSIASALTTPASRYGLIGVFSTSVDDPSFKYKIRYMLRPQHTSRDEYKSRGTPEYETVSCRNEQEVCSTLDSMFFSYH